MHRYRVNLTLLIAIVVGSIAILGGSYGLYKFQKSRNAERLLDRAEAAKAEGDLKRTAELLVDYLRIRPRNEEAMADLSNVLADLANEPKSEPVHIRNAMAQLEMTVREYPERDDLRRRLVDLYMSRRVRMLKQALDHVSQLLNRKPNDPELEVMRSECYFAASDPKAVDHAYKLVGYDKAADEFDESKAIAPHDAGVYSRLAYKLKSDMFEGDLANKVIDRMVEANPESGEALIAKGSWLEASDKKEEAIPLVRKALELEPDNPSIVIANARLAVRDEKPEEAIALLEEAIKKHPTDTGLYQTLSEASIYKKDLEGALAACDRGIAAVPADQSQVLMVQKARLQLQQNKINDVRKTIADMRKSEMIPSAYPDYFEGRLLMDEKKFLEAVQLFEKYQQFFANNPVMGLELNMMLGFSRENLGQDELALEAFNLALQIDPTNPMAEQGKLRAMQKIGRVGRDNEGVSIYAALAEELAKPESQQDWESFDKLCEQYIEKMQLGEAMLKILRGEVMMRRGKYPEARKLLVEAYKMEPDNLGVRRAAVKLFAADPDQGPAKALTLLDKVVEDLGDMPILRLERADLLSMINDENLTDQLFALTEGLDKWDTPQKVQLWKGMAEKFARLRNEEARAECLRKVAELQPGDLPTLIDMFNVSLAANDATGVKQAQDEILELVGSKEDPTWLYTEANRLLSEWRTNGGQGDGVKQAAELVDRALASRRDWSDLINLQADIALAQGNVRQALESYDRAATLGRQDARSLFQYIKLLRARGRFVDAVAQMEKINRESLLRLLGSDYSESLLQVGRNAEGVDAAKEFAAQAPNNAAVQLWLGRFLTQASSFEADKSDRKKTLLDEAGAAFAKSVEVDPNAAENWLALVGYYAATGDGVKADDTIRSAQLALPEDQNLLMFARAYEMVGRTIDAESLYSLALEGAEKADRARVSRMIAQFYLGPTYNRPDAIDKATPLVNSILKDAAEGTITADDPSAQWARSTAAKMLARGGGYQDLRNAERLIASNSDNGVLSLEDRILMAEILAPRPEPVSRMKAANLLEEIGANQRLNKQAELNLARLYFALGEWRKCREQMLDIIGRYPDDPAVKLAYIEMLLQRGGPSEIDLAVRQVQRLQEIAPNEVTTREMLARVAYEKGKKKEAAQAVIGMLPRDASKITKEQIPLLQRIARRLMDFDDLPRAQKLMELAAKLGGVNERFLLAQFIGERVDLQQGLDAMEELRDEIDTERLVQGGLAVLRVAEIKNEEVSPDALAQVRGWLDRGLREDPELISLRLQEAELYDVQHEYEKAAAAYRVLLDRKDLTGVGRAVVLNNLAYLLALSTDEEASVSEASRLVTEAVDILGPGTEILDTRAVISIAAKRYDDAIADLKLAVIDNPTASKYFHLATAYALSGQEELAKQAWEEAVDRGLSRDNVSRLEKDQYDQTKQKVEAGGITSREG
jgi:tetratricopeptide (TPR) repeat protein